EVDVVVAHRNVAHGLEPRRGVEQRGVDAVAPGRQHAVLVGDAPAQLVGTPGRVVLLVVLDFEALAQLVDDFLEGGASHQDPGLHLPLTSRTRPAAATGQCRGTGTAAPPQGSVCP